MTLRSSLLRGTAIALLFACVYMLSVDADAPSLKRNNFVLDADIVQVARVVAAGHLRSLGRHPLYGIFLGGPGLLVDSVFDDSMFTAKCFSAAAAAAASVLAFWYLAGLLKSRTDALWFCLLASLSASVWLFAAVPETHIFNYTAVVFAFWLLGRMTREDGADHMPRHTLWAILAGVFLMGITLTNIVYIALAFVLGLSRLPLPRLTRARWLAIFSIGVLYLFMCFSVLQLHLAPDEDSMLIDPSNPLTSRFIRWDRALDPHELVSEIRMLLFNSVIASKPDIELVLTPSGIQQMIQFAPLGRSDGALLVCLAVALAVLLSRRSGAGFGLDGLLAVGVVLFNLVLFFFFRGNGQPFIFSIHTAFPLVVLLALLYRKSRAAPKRLVLRALVCAIVVQNALFMVHMSELVDRTCVAGLQMDYGICTEWDPPTSP